MGVEGVVCMCMWCLVVRGMVGVSGSSGVVCMGDVGVVFTAPTKSDAPNNYYFA